MKKLLIFTLLALSLMLVSCDSLDTSSTDQTPTITETASSASTQAPTYEDIEVEEIISNDVNFDNGTWEEYTNESYITLDGSSTSYLITEEGTYLLTGTITQSIIVQLQDDEDVRFILDNVTIETSENAAIMILSADDVVISVLEGTTNTLSDSSTYSLDYEDYDATIYSDADVVINGLGTLNIYANANNALQTKDDLMIVDVTLNITSVDDGIIGRDSLLVQNANITVTSDGDAIKTTNDESTEKGFLYIESGTFNLNAGSDGFDAANSIIIDNGTFNIVSGGEGIKSDKDIYITDGDFTIDSVEDAIDSDGQTVINGGTFNLEAENDAIHSNSAITLSADYMVINASDDGIHSDTDLTVLQGTYIIENAYEGLEGKTIYLVDGSIDITASDDGINASDPEITVVEGPFQADLSSSTGQIFMSGGQVFINAEDDGVDANGSFTMTGGILVINGPTSGMQSAIDYDLEWNQNGGILIAVAGYGNETKSPTSATQITMVYNTETIHSSNEAISLMADGQALYTFIPEKYYQVLLISTPDLNNSTAYTIAFDGDIEGTLTNGYYSNADVSNYETLTTISLDTTINTFNITSSTGFPPGGGRPR